MPALRYDYEVFVRQLLRQTNHKLSREWKGIINLSDTELLQEINTILKENGCVPMNSEELNRKLL